LLPRPAHRQRDHLAQWYELEPVPLSLAVALVLSVLLHGLALVLLPEAQTVVTVVKPPIVMDVVETVKPVPPAPTPSPTARAPRCAKRAVAPAQSPVRDLDGTAPMPAVPEPPPLFRLPIAPDIDAPRAPEAAAPVQQTDAVLEAEVKAPYPEAALREEVDGTVVLRVTIGEDGRVLEAVVVEDPGHGLGEAARAAVLKARFTPATRGGVRVRTTITWRYRFELR
jgi:protein TonB